MTAGICESCGLIQLREVVSPGDLYASGICGSTSSVAYLSWLNELSDFLVKSYSLESAKILEIGSADGSLLAALTSRGAGPVWGYEPSLVYKDIWRNKGISVTHKLFSMQTCSECPIVPVQVVVMRHLIEHVDDLQDLLSAVRHVLSVDGLLVIETPDVDVLLNRPLYFDFLHEHLSYFSELALLTLLGRHGFEVVEVRRVPIHEGSLLVISQKKERVALDDPRANSLNAHFITSYMNRCRVFATQQSDYIRAFKQFIQREIERGVSFAGYGAGLRINSTLGMLGLSSRELLFICDKNSLLHGKFTYGSYILICPPQRLLDDPVDALIIFAHPYQEEIVKELGAYRDRKKRFVSIYPLPYYLD